MSRKKTISILISSTLACSLLLSACSTPVAQSISAAEISTAAFDAETTTLGYISEIDKTKIMSFEISVDAADWQTLLDNATDKEYIPADITINGTTIENVGIRAKGNSSLSSVARDDTTDRYSFKIKFNEYVKGQTWLGLDKIVLNSNYADATSMKEYLSYDIMSFIGVDAPLFAYTDISVNGESWGFYLAVEDVDSGYLDRVHNGEGELYKPDNDTDLGGFENNRPNNAEGSPFPQAAPDGTETAERTPPAPDNTTQTDSAPPSGQNGGPGGGMGNMSGNGVSLQYTGDDEANYSAIFDNDKTKTDEEDHQRVITALKNLSDGTDLETYINVDEVLRYFAAHTVVVNLDSYISNMGHNYLLYENNGQLSMIPWDYNMAFGGFQSSSASEVVNFPIDTPVSGVSMEDRPMLSQLLTVPEYMEKYHEYLQEILDGYFKDGQFEQTVDSLNALISEHIQNDPSAFYTYETYQTAVTELKKLGVLRAESIQGQLDGIIPSTTEGQKADPSALIDASDLNLSALGSQSGGGRGMNGMPGQRGGAKP